MIVIALFTALIAPRFIDWSSYKQDFERETSRIIGQSVEVLGETNVSILPLPSVTFGGLAIGKNADGTPLMTVDQFALDIELMPMLKGEVSIVELNLVRPRINLVVDENGAIAWTNRHELAVDPENIKLENFNVTNGEIKIHGLAGGRTLSLEQLDGKISAKSLYGPWRIDADGYVGSKRASINISTGHLQDDGSIRIRLGAQQAELPYKMTLDGEVKIDNDVLRWQGDYQVSAQKVENKQKQPLPIFLEGKFNATPRLVDLPEFRLEIGDRADPYTITGDGSAQIGEIINFDIQADGRQIDLDRVANVQDEASATVEHSLEQRLNILRNIIEQIPVPQANGTIDLSLPAIVAGDTVIREISTIFSPEGNGWKIKRLNAVFPGNTKFEVRGKVGLREAYGFTGNMLVASRQPTGLAAWLGKRNDPFIRKLRSAGFSADVVISENQTSFENLELVLGNAVLKGKLQRIGGALGTPAIIARLDGDKINLDDLRAVFALIADDNAQAISSHDLDININAGTLTGFNISAENVDARFRVAGGTISIEKLSSSNFFGATLSSEGRIENLLSKPNGNFKLAINAKEAGELFNFVSSRISPDAPGKKFVDNLARSANLLNNLELDLQLNSHSSAGKNDNGSNGQAVLSGNVAGTELEITVGFNGGPGDISNAILDISVSASNTDPLKLLQQMNVPILPVSVDGPLEISANFTGMAKDGFESFISAKMQDTNGSVSGMMLPFHNRWGPLNVTFASKDIDPLLLLSGLALRAGGIEQRTLPMSFSTKVNKQNSKIIFENGKGQIGGNDFQFDVDFENNRTSNKRVDGKINITRLDLPFLASLALFSSRSLKQGEANGWSKENFKSALLLGVDGNVDINVTSSDIGLDSDVENVSGSLALVDGSINLNQLEGNWHGGEINADISFTNADGIGSISAQVNLENIAVEDVAKEFQIPEFASAMGNVVGNIEGSGRSVAAIVSSLVGSGTADLKSLNIRNLNSSPLGSVFEVVDREGFEIQDKNVLPIVTDVIENGTIEVAEVSVPFVIAAGKIRSRNVIFAGGNSTMRGALEIDITDGNQKSELLMTFDPGIEWVDGADPQIVLSWSGELKNPKRDIDVQPLSGFLSLRNFEHEQRRVDLLQATILEKQRLRRDVVVTNARVRYRQRLRAEELHRQRQAFLQNEEIQLHRLGAIRHLELLKIERQHRAEKLRLEALEVERLAKLERDRLAKIEKDRLAEIARLEVEAENIRKAAEAEEKRKATELKRKRAEELSKAAAEQARKLEEERLANVAEKLRLAEEAKRQALRKQEERGTIAKKKLPRLDDSSFAKRLNDFLEER